MNEVIIDNEKNLFFAYYYFNSFVSLQLCQNGNKNKYINYHRNKYTGGIEHGNLR